jgi:hypothetical protein
MLCDALNQSEARKDLNSFVQNVLKDEKGQLVEQAEIHIAWHQHITYCWDRGLNPVILAPWGHGKSTQVVIGMPLYWLGIHPEQRIKIVCNSDQNAMARVKTVNRYITMDKDFQKFFPEIHPAKDESWTNHEIFIERPAGVRSIDPSLQAKGIFSTGIGGRADLILFDDIVDRRNAIDQPELRRKLPDIYQDVWMSRLEPAGHTAYIATVWHQDDNTFKLMKDSSYCTMKQEVNDKFDKIKTTLVNCPDDDHPVIRAYGKAKGSGVDNYTNVPLWQNKWNKAALKKKYGSTTVSQRSFDRGFRQKAITSSDLMYPSFASCIEYGVKPKDILDPDYTMYYTGVDLSSSKRAGNVIFTLAYNFKNNVKIPVDIRSGPWTSPRVADELNEVSMLYSPEVITVETNSQQATLVEWIQRQSNEYTFWDRIWSYETLGNIKRSEVGLPAMEVEFSNRGWRILIEEKHHEECECGFCLWILEMNSYPFSTTNDHLMACWFCRESCKEGLSDGIIER